MIVGVWQTNYIPWKGYFDYINDVDVFCFYDEVQYTKNDWRNRNQLLNDTGLFWLTIPISSRFTKYKISEVLIERTDILAKHFETIRQCYSRAPFSKEILQLLAPIYLDTNWTHLSDLNKQLLKTISRYVGITTMFVDSREYELKDTKIERLLHLNKQLTEKDI
jgi:hypothetical protein